MSRNRTRRIVIRDGEVLELHERLGDGPDRTPPLEGIVAYLAARQGAKKRSGKFGQGPRWPAIARGKNPHPVWLPKKWRPKRIRYRRRDNRLPGDPRPRRRRPLQQSVAPGQTGKPPWLAVTGWLADRVRRLGGRRGR